MGKLNCEDDIKGLTDALTDAAKKARNLNEDLQGTVEEYNLAVKYLKEDSAATVEKRAQYMSQHARAVSVRARNIKSFVDDAKKSLKTFEQKLESLQGKMDDFVSDYNKTKKKSKGGKNDDDDRVDKSCNGIKGLITFAKGQVPELKGSVTLTETLFNTLSGLSGALNKIADGLVEAEKKKEMEKQLRDFASAILKF